MKKWIKWSLITIGVLIISSLLFYSFGIKETASASPDFVHYVMKMGKSTDPLKFGSAVFSVSAPLYSIFCDQEMKTNAPSPDPLCWTATSSFGENYILPYGVEVDIADWLKTAWTTDALITGGQLDKFDRTDRVAVRFDPDKAIEFTVSAPEMTKFGDSAIITLKMTNNIPSTMDVWVEVKIESSIFNVYDTFSGESQFYKTKISVDEGISEKTISVPLAKLGKNTLSISLIPIIHYSEGEYLESTKSKSVSTTVVSSVVYEGKFKEEQQPLPNNAIILTPDSIIKVQETTTAEKVVSNSWIWIIVVILIFGIVGWQGWLLWRRK